MTPELSPSQPSPFSCIFPREKEEQWAASNSLVTKVLAWSLIGGFVLSIIGSMSGNSADLGGILFLIAGFTIKGGSQAWLRFVTFLTAGSALTLLPIIWTLSQGEPVVLESRPDQWVDHHDHSFWLLLVSPLMFLTGQAILGGICLRTRSLTFWTKTTRIWGWIMGGILLLMLGTNFYEAVKTSPLRASTNSIAQTELRAIRSHLHTHGTSSHGGPGLSLDTLLEANPRILKLSWKYTPNGTRIVYTKPHATGTADRAPPGKFFEFEEFYKLPSGDWTLIQLQLLLPD